MGSITQVPVHLAGKDVEVVALEAAFHSPGPGAAVSQSVSAACLAEELRAQLDSEMAAVMLWEVTAEAAKEEVKELRNEMRLELESRAQDREELLCLRAELDAAKGRIAGANVPNMAQPEQRFSFDREPACRSYEMESEGRTSA